MPSGGFETRKRRQRRLRNALRLKRMNEKFLRDGHSTVKTLTQGYKQRKRLTEETSNVSP